MNIPAYVNSAFSTLRPNMQLAWDSTSIGLLKECPRKYQLTMGTALEPGWSPRAESVHLRFGQEVHSARQVYDTARASGLGHDDALDAAVDAALRSTFDYNLMRPWFSDHKEKNRYTLLRTIVWYLDEYGPNDPLQTVMLANGKPAVELSFRMQTDMRTPDSEPVMLCGHMDRLVTANFDQRTYIADIKTTGSTIGTEYFSKFSPDNQFSLYSFASKIVYSQPVAGLIVDAIQVAVTFSRPQRGLVPRHPAQLEEWYKDLGVWLAQAYDYARRGHWPMNDKSCNNYGGCPFRGICAHVPSIRDEWLQASFVHRAWDPLRARGDI
jgi:hypothetical protein